MRKIWKIGNESKNLQILVFLNNFHLWKFWGEKRNFKFLFYIFFNMENFFLWVMNSRKDKKNLMWRKKKLNFGKNRKLTVILAMISYFLPFFVINLQHNSSTDADRIWKTGCEQLKVFFKFFISSFKVIKHAIFCGFSH